MALPDSFLQELKIKTDIEDVISSYVTLKRRGRTLVGLCPFHNEKTPSFTVYPETQSFYCFGCSAGGDSVGFIKRIENLDYIDAVKLLAQRAGMQLPEDGYDDSLVKKRRRILEMNRAAAKFYHSFMLSDEGKIGLKYFQSRGLTQKTITRFGLGYAPDSWDALVKHLNSLGYRDFEIVEAGLAKRSSKNQSRIYDMFRNRVMTPYIDIRGNVIAFGGRVLDYTKPKYINTSDTLVFKKTNELFAMNIAKDSGDSALILCEGYMDVIALHQAGFTNAVAGCGTALTNEQVRLISRYANEVILCYDTDEAGKQALTKAIRLFNNTDIKIRIPALTGGKDPDEIIKTQGVERFSAMLEGAANEIEFEIINLRNKHNLNSTQGKLDFLNDVSRLLANSSRIEQDLYASRICEELDVHKDSLMAQIKQYESQQSRYSMRRKYEEERRSYQRDVVRESYVKSASARKINAEKRMLSILLRYPKCYKLCDGFDEKMLSEGFITKVYQLTIDFIKKGIDCSLTAYSQYLTDAELGELSGMINNFNDSNNYEAEFSDCLKTIAEESNKKNPVDAGGLSDDDFLKLMKDISNNKVHKEEEK